MCATLKLIETTWTSLVWIITAVIVWIVGVAFRDVATLQGCLRVDARQSRRLCTRIVTAPRIRCTSRLVEQVLLVRVVIEVAVASIVDAAGRCCHLKSSRIRLIF